MTFYDKFKPEEFTLKDFEHWIVVLRPKQITLGDAVIILKRQVPSIADATPEEMGEFSTAVAWYEGKCNAVFSPDKYNYVAAMMKDNFVHFHAIPRYSEVKHFADIEWKDEFWPKPISLVNASTEANVLHAVYDSLRD